MASLVKEPLFETSGRAPGQNKTLYYLAITKTEVIWRWWKISLRAVDRNTRPGEEKQSHQEMLEDSSFQSEISTVFGRDILDYTKRLCQGHWNFLEHLPDPLLLRILGFLELEDVGQLLRTSRRFWKLCQSEQFWESAVRQRCSTLPDDVVSLSRGIGWRRIFFTNKIQLQLLLNRHRVKTLEQDSGDRNPPTDRSPKTDEGPLGSSISSREVSPSDTLSAVVSLEMDSSAPSDLNFSPEDGKHGMMEDFLADVERFRLLESGEADGE
ncbi:unnamed protein product [Knipowitschia caucasica]|uniref:F-box domain-containing protein n=1 Tax=Knipowitschia caucasica TaxID=637954 RepID=A0AAV2JNT8_KNICA